MSSSACERRSQISARSNGQTTAEYALVVLVASTIAGLALVWALNGGLDVVFDFVTRSVLGFFDRQ